MLFSFLDMQVPNQASVIHWTQNPSAGKKEFEKAVKKLFDPCNE
jgi:hypothetical protein